MTGSPNDNYLGRDIPKLGFGLMRLPKKGIFTDTKQVEKMVDAFMGAGFTYFDTAYVYPGSEQAIRKTLVKRYPRESFQLATKLNAWMVPNAQMAKAQFYTSLRRTGAGYFDYYLLHALMKSNYKIYDRRGIWEFVQQKKEEGLIKHIGFSFHSDHELLDQILTDHPEAEFVQLQLNYADWESSRVESRANYEVARSHGKSIVVMEPLKGGKLANPPKKVREILDSYGASKSSYASWGIRFVAGLDGIITVLSGMSNMGQMLDNISYMRDFKPLNAAEHEIIRQAQAAMSGSNIIPCTNCHYCMPGCPKDIKIPDILDAMNMRIGDGLIEESQAAYNRAVAKHGCASDCIECGQCERACTQGIEVMSLLKDCAETFEK